MQPMSKYNPLDDRAYAIARYIADQTDRSVADCWADVWLYQSKSAVLRMIVGMRLEEKNRA